MTWKLAASVLSADFGHLSDQVQEAEAAGADWIHVDVMDGRFVPTITIGPLVVRALRQSTSLPLDVHLMIESPERYLEQFVEAGADWLTVHAEASLHLHRTLQQIQGLGARVGVALNPATPVSALDEVLPMLDMVLLLLVNPGFGGQQMIPGSLNKVARMRKRMDDAGLPHVALEVDGGVTANNAAAVAAAGAGILVAGSAVFGGVSPIASNVRALRASSQRIDSMPLTRPACPATSSA